MPNIQFIGRMFLYVSGHAVFNFEIDKINVDTNLVNGKSVYYTTPS